MVIAGLQKLTLLDFPGHTACTVFTAGCNFRCPFCHNAPLVIGAKDEHGITEDEFFSFLDKRKGTLDGVAVTGGEPLLQPDIKDFLRKIHEHGFLVKLDTNGSFPEKLAEIADERLAEYIAVDIKASPEKYPAAVGRQGYDTERIRESIEILRKSGIEHEFRTTVVAELHTEEDIRAITAMIKGEKNYFLQNFVDSGELISNDMHGVPEKTMKQYLEAARELIPTAQIRGL